MTLFELLYFLGFSIKKRRAFKNQKALPYKVVSIGNITLGGTGKTPATIALTKEAQKRGLTPCILTRGYKGKSKEPFLINSVNGQSLDPCQVGDEALLMAKKLKGVPIVKAKNRYEAAMFALSSLPSASCPNLFLLDDGFQHWNLYKDKNILLLDRSNPFGNRRLLPIGSLREPISAVIRADIIVITNTKLKNISTQDERHEYPVVIEEILKEVRLYNANAPIFFAEHTPLKFLKNNMEIKPLEWANGKKFFGFCGIGNPQSFKKTLLSLNLTLTGFKTFRDHHRYTYKDVKSIIKDAKKSSAEWIVTTEKDIMRLKNLSFTERLVSLEIGFTTDKGFYDEVFKEII